MEEDQDPAVGLPPACLEWSIEDVGEWVESLGFPEYKVLNTLNDIGLSIFVFPYLRIALLAIESTAASSYGWSQPKTYLTLE